MTNLLIIVPLGVWLLGGGGLKDTRDTLITASRDWSRKPDATLTARYVDPTGGVYVVGCFHSSHLAAKDAKTGLISEIGGISNTCKTAGTTILTTDPHAALRRLKLTPMVEKEEKERP